LSLDARCESADDGRVIDRAGLADFLRRRREMLHPEVGMLHLTCEVLLTPEEDLKVHAFFPTEGTDAREKLDLLRVIGTQDLRSTADIDALGADDREQSQRLLGW
jgi:transcription regulator MmyB-like protein